ncbi:nucleoside hydrolase [Luteolibacter sp. SL250]|uniref:nucleoside hydrolase n=1 Tax=Luteolibacter sp. SL250 TaxID=2995170 RepID=UPI002270B669|nr:nucleoside hydrolase [Luteolibacter sp. SL250]WAC19980.1 nucleoside hydrolase [Luteolibacter sp. SL250]
MLKHLALVFLSAVLAHSEPVPIIFDTDMGNDVDDAMALAMIHSLGKRGACKLLAVTVTKDHPKAASYIDALNTFYGQPDIPIGVVRDGPTKDEGKYLKATDDAAKYPRDLKSGADAPDALELLRKTLAAQPDQSVTLIQVGFFTNFARLLDTPGDGHSPLNGRDLIAKKVKLLSIMAGAFQTIGGHDNHYIEYNVKYDIPAARKLAVEWPSPIVWSGFEIGIAAAYPHQSIERDFNYVPHHPVKESYILYNPPPHDRPTWDLTSVLAAVFPDRGYFTFSVPGTVTVGEDGFTRFSKKEKGRDRFLIMDQAQAASVREACVHLTAEPPAR